MRGHRPWADLEHAREGLVRVALDDQTHDGLLARAEYQTRCLGRRWTPHDGVVDTVHTQPQQLAIGCVDEWAVRGAQDFAQQVFHSRNTTSRTGADARQLRLTRLRLV